MAATSEKGEASGVDGQIWSKVSLAEFLCSLNLKRKVESLKEGAKWMVVMRLLSLRPLSATSLKKAISFMWASTQKVAFRDLEDNRSIV